MAAVRAATAGAERVMTYGSSMGARRGALVRRGAAGANAALADLAAVDFDRPDQGSVRDALAAGRPAHLFPPEIDGRLTCACRPLIVDDFVTGDDERQVRLIAAEIEADLVGLRYVHHPATTYLNEMRLLGPLVFDLLGGVVDVAVSAPRLRAAARQCGHLGRLAELQPLHRTRLATALAARGGEQCAAQPHGGVGPGDLPRTGRRS